VVRRVAALAGCAMMVLAAVGTSADLTILYTNDLHLRFGRLRSIEALIAAERTAGNPILLLDAGDTWQDFRRPLAAVWGADEMVAWMDRVGYDAMALGNHDMYWGARRLDALVGEATFPVLCANLVPIRAGIVPFAPSARLDAGGLSVLLIGLITEELLPYTAYPMVRVIPAAEAVRHELDRAAEDGRPDLIVVVAHLPVNEAKRLTAANPEIDVFITGHSHEETSDPVRVGSTLIVQSGAFGKNLGRLSLDVDPETGEHRLTGNALLPTEKAPTDIGRGLLQLLAVAAATVAAALLVLL
jgi:2',3'-cyclic-nucleotide 2'-phosphodiesterase (5'-nucleotidase family)